ncbi:MAG: GGDEF domain-containing protein [Comamonas sp.]|nr:GGDEF domain-containing protein [Candidatus Comamonas equi]
MTTLICVVVWSYYRDHRYLLWACIAQALLAVGLTVQMLLNAVQRLHYSPYTTFIYLAAISCLAQAMALRMRKELDWRPITIINLLTMAAMLHASHSDLSNVWRLVVMSIYVATLHGLVLLQLRKCRPQHILDRISMVLYGLFGLSMLLRLVLLPMEVRSMDATWITRQVAWWFTTASVMLLGVGLTSSLTASALIDTTLHLRRERNYDSLTGVMTRRAFEERCAPVPYARQLRALVYADLDHFKRINDQYGHAIGDEVLHYFGKVLQQNLRSADVVGRIGGEEFAIALHGVDLPQAKKLMARVAKCLREYRHPSPDVALDVTASFGLVMLQPTETLDSAMQRADLLLYAAKAAGRNRLHSEDEAKAK